MSHLVSAHENRASRRALLPILVLVLLSTASACLPDQTRVQPTASSATVGSVRPTATERPQATVTPSTTPTTTAPTPESEPSATVSAGVPAPKPTVIPRATRVPGPRGPICAEVNPSSVPLTNPVPDVPSPELARLLGDAFAGVPGQVGVAVKHLTTGESAYYGEQRVFEAASLYKLNLVYGAYALAAKGELSFADKMVVSEKAAFGYGDGDPALQPGEELTLEEAVRCAITVSDNVSAHSLLESLPVWRINADLAGLGLKQTEIDNGTRTTPEDMLRFMELLSTGGLVSPQASQQMLSLLFAQQVNDRLPLLLPSGTRVAHKTGNLPGLRHDVGIVYGPTGPYAIAVLVDGLPEAEEPSVGEVASTRVAEASRKVYDYFKPDPSADPSPAATAPATPARP